MTQPGGLVIWSTHAHENERTKPYLEKRHQLTEDGLWESLFKTDPFVSMPSGDSEIKHAVYVHRIV